MFSFSDEDPLDYGVDHLRFENERLRGLVKALTSENKIFRAKISGHDMQCVVCKEYKSDSAFCSATLPEDALQDAPITCKWCGEYICLQCKKVSKECAHCQKWWCKKCAKHCGRVSECCSRFFCDEVGLQVRDEGCANCAEARCPECSQWCHSCEANFCKKHFADAKPCEHCPNLICRRCSEGYGTCADH